VESRPCDVRPAEASHLLSPEGFDVLRAHALLSRDVDGRRGQRRRPSVLLREIAGTRVGLSANGRLYVLRDLQLKLMTACREAGLSAVDYPLNCDEMGYRALSVWLRKRLQLRLPISANTSLEDAWEARSQPYSGVELDGHKLDVHLRASYVDATGVSVDIESERLFVIALIDVCTPPLQRHRCARESSTSCARSPTHRAATRWIFIDGAQYLREIECGWLRDLHDDLDECDLSNRWSADRAS